MLCIYAENSSVWKNIREFRVTMVTYLLILVTVLSKLKYLIG